MHIAFALYVLERHGMDEVWHFLGLFKSMSQVSKIINMRGKGYTYSIDVFDHDFDSEKELPF